MTNPTVGSTVPVSLAPGGVEATLAVTQPDGSAITPAPTVTATEAAFTAAFDTTQPGRHLVTWYVPTEDQVFTDVVDVWPADPRYLVSLEAALAQVSASNTPDATKAAMPLYVATATYVIEHLVGPVLLDVKTYRVPRGKTTAVLPAVGVAGVTVTVDGEPWTSDALDVDDTAGVVSGLPYTTSVVLVEYTVGAATVPANLQLAALELIRHLWQSSRQSGRPGAIAAAADTVSTPFGFAVPKRVVELCGATLSAPGFA